MSGEGLSAWAGFALGQIAAESQRTRDESIRRIFACKDNSVEILRDRLHKCIARIEEQYAKLQRYKVTIAAQEEEIRVLRGRCESLEVRAIEAEQKHHVLDKWADKVVAKINRYEDHYGPPP